MHEHRRDQEAQARIALMITSDTRTPETDETGKMAIRILAQHHGVKPFSQKEEK